MQQAGNLMKAMIHRHILEMSRYPITIVSSSITVATLALIFLYATRTFTSDTLQEQYELVHTTGGVMLYGFILFLFTSDTLWSVGYNVRLEQSGGTLESLYLTPASRLIYLMSRAIYPLIWTSLNVGVTLICVRLTVGVLPAEHLLLAVTVFVLTLSGIFGLGFCIAALTLVVKETAQTITNFLQFLLLIVCAIVVPFQSLPEGIRLMSYLIPLSYCVDLFRSALLGFPPGFPELTNYSIEFLIACIWAIAMPIIGCAAYTLAERRVQIDGTLAEF